MVTRLTYCFVERLFFMTAQELLGLRRGPSDARELVDPRAGVQLSKERLVLVPFVAKDEAIDDAWRVHGRARSQLREGKTPASAMQKLRARDGCMF